jgi:homocysteine S-methyltransferase
MNPLAPFLENKGAVVLDGALATELERHGADLRDPLWSAKVLLENPDLIRQVHLDYFRAGADIATTSSYQASIPGLMQRGLTRTQAHNMLRLSVRLAEEARFQFLCPDVAFRDGASDPSPPAPLPQGERGVRRTPLIAASIGCYGASLHDGSEYRGDYGLSRDQLIDWHRPRLEILATSGADLLACETIPSLLEGEALVQLLGEHPNASAWLSFSCKDEQHLCHGESFADAVALAEGAGNIVAVGVNCTAPQFVDGLLASAAGIVKKPLVVYPNSGEAWDAQRHCWRGASSDLDWRRSVAQWYARGARLIGGCCRTTPDTIRQIKAALTPLREPSTQRGGAPNQSQNRVTEN